jgi:hypothetical protein
MSPYYSNFESRKGVMLQSDPDKGYEFHGYIWLGDRQYKFQAFRDDKPGKRRWDMRLTLHVPSERKP